MNPGQAMQQKTMADNSDVIQNSGLNRTYMQKVGPYMKDVCDQAPNGLEPVVTKLNEADAVRMLGPDLDCLPQEYDRLVRTEIVIVECPIIVVCKMKRQICELVPRPTQVYKVTMPATVINERKCIGRCGGRCEGGCGENRPLAACAGRCGGRCAGGCGAGFFQQQQAAPFLASTQNNGGGCATGNCNGGPMGGYNHGQQRGW